MGWGFFRTRSIVHTLNGCDDTGNNRGERGERREREKRREKEREREQLKKGERDRSIKTVGGVVAAKSTMEAGLNATLPPLLLSFKRSPFRRNLVSILSVFHCIVIMFQLLCCCCCCCSSSTSFAIKQLLCCRPREQKTGTLNAKKVNFYPQTNVLIVTMAQVQVAAHVLF